MASPAPSSALDATVARRRVRVQGVVQGVGFRPFVRRLATDLGVVGFVGNDAAGVVAEVEGDSAVLDEFVARLGAEAPPLARIDRIEAAPTPVRGEHGFAIVDSHTGPRAGALVPPDIATCTACLADVADPADRRYRYPFTNCTDCGPRFTIIRDLPYDRVTTTMSAFEMCDDCAAEYADPDDRRYHAQPVACPACGPHLRFERGAEAAVGTDAALAAVHRALAAGQVVAIKGLGGYHLACDATSDEAVGRLRRRKGRADKPFAVMVPDIGTAETVARLDDIERETIASPARPVVLLRRRDDGARPGELSPLVAPGNPLIGVMLPYTPLHHLLFEPVPGAGAAPPKAIVLTSGNRADEPICFDDADARDRLGDLADAFCTHDRPIEVPCDDSVVRIIDGAVLPIRRSRGYAPLPIDLPLAVAPVVAVGAELKNTCCVASGRRAWVGQHVGDMENLETLHAFGASVESFRRMYRVDPVGYGADLHPGYLTRRWALDVAARDPARPVVGVQHHHAHVAAVMAEHGATGPVLGFAFDGTGYGHADDGSVQIWGGEVLRVDDDGFERVAHLAPLPLPGGDEGVRNPCRIAVAWLAALGVPLDPALPAVAACDPVELDLVVRQVERDLGCVPTTSMGRLFDVVSSLLGVRHRVGYEAQAAIELEAVAERGRPGGVTLQFGFGADAQPDRATVVDPRPLLEGIVDASRSGRPVADIALAFHLAVAELVAGLAGRFARGCPVALSGGVFQNALLVRLTTERLDGFEVLTHRAVPPNDGGLALGQAVIAGRHLARAGEET